MLGQGYEVAIATYISVKETLLSIAEQFGIPTTVETARGGEKQMSVQEMRTEIRNNLPPQHLIICDDADGWALSLRTWLQTLYSKGALLCLVGNQPKATGVFLKLLKIPLASPSDQIIREIMMTECQLLNYEATAAQLAQLQTKAGKNLMLARRVVQEAAMGLDIGAEHTQYFDISPFTITALLMFGAVRFLGLGLNDRALYIVGGMSMLLALAGRQLAKGLSRNTRGLGK